MRKDPVKIPDSEGELNRASVARSPQLIIIEIDSIFEEEDLMSLNLRKGSRDLMAGQNKGSSSKEASKSQLPFSFCLSPSSSYNHN